MIFPGFWLKNSTAKLNNCETSSQWKTLMELDGQLNEVDLDEKTGLSEEETPRILLQLLFEHKIIYEENRACNYSLMKKSKTK